MNFSWIYQEFDTNILGLKTAKVTNSNPLPTGDLHATITGLQNDLKRNDIRYATYRFPANNYPLIQALEQHGFLLIDIMIALEAKLSHETVAFNTKNIFQPTPKDNEELIKLASSVFSLNRFYNDPLIPKEKADVIYCKWMENSLLGKAADKILMYKEEIILGFVTMQNSGHIPLIGVAQEARGKGIAKTLTLAALEYFREIKLEKAAIETQIINTPAIRAYTTCGFKHSESYVTYRIFT